MIKFATNPESQPALGLIQTNHSMPVSRQHDDDDDDDDDDYDEKRDDDDDVDDGHCTKSFNSITLNQNFLHELFWSEHKYFSLTQCRLISITVNLFAFSQFPVLNSTDLPPHCQDQY